MSIVEPIEEPGAPDTTLKGLSFGDGFQFGCGFFLAGALVTSITALLIVLIAVILSVTGVGLFDSVLGQGPLPGP